MNVIIIGGGYVGSYIANILLKSHCSVKVIENREKVLNKLSNDLPQENIVVGSGSDPNVLEAAGIYKADVVAAVTGADEVNLVVATIAKFEFNVPRIIARVNNPKNAWLFNSGMGVDIRLDQADLMSHMIVEEMNLDTVQILMKLGRGDYMIVQTTVNDSSKAVGKDIKDLIIPRNTLIIAIYRDKETIIPCGDTVIKKGDQLIVFSDEKGMSNIHALFGTSN